MLRRSHREIRQILRGELLQTKTAREIARKANVRTAIDSGELVKAVNPMTTFSWPRDDANGYEGTHGAGAELPFPRDTPTIYPHPEHITVRQADWRSFSEARLIANVTAVGTSGASLLFIDDEGEGERGFSVAAPSAPLDSVGFHVSAWRQFAWESSDTGMRRVRTRLVIANPGGSSGSFNVGLCQVQAR